MCKQRTISREIRATGVGLHSGNKVYMRFLPHHEDGGIIFRRTDLDPMVDIPADGMRVSDTMMSSNISVGDAKIGTVEHLMSALAGMGIDNLIIEVSADEIPIMDGSAAPFIYLIQSAGIAEQSVAKRFIKVKKTIEVAVDDKVATLAPSDGFSLDFSIDFDHPAFDKDKQHASMALSTGSFIDEISRARTFGFLKDIEYLRANNLALGGSMENAIVVDEQKVLNEGGLRFSDEFVRHKMLDAIGDLYLAGHQILGAFKAFKSGHHLNNLLVRELFSSPDNYEMVSYDSDDACPIRYISPLAVAEAS